MVNMNMTATHILIIKPFWQRQECVGQSEAVIHTIDPVAQLGLRSTVYHLSAVNKDNALCYKCNVGYYMDCKDNYFVICRRVYYIF